MLALLLLTGGFSAPSRAEGQASASATGDTLATATFAGGCFWCMEPPFDKVPGVVSTVSGYLGGRTVNPTYKQVSAGGSGHAEAVQVRYDPLRVTYQALLDVYWRNIDPLTPDAQFCDIGDQYRSVIFTHDTAQRRIAEASKSTLEKSRRFSQPIVTQIVPAGRFYPAEEYHQDYYLKNPVRYKFYRGSCGRDKRLAQLWGADPARGLVVPATREPMATTRGGSAVTQAYQRPTKEQLRERLTPIQYKVTQEDATEPPFKNEYWDNKESGIYVDVVSGEPLFSSADKYDSGTGWPSFTRPLVAANIRTKKDWGLLGFRTEVRSVRGDSHLGHVFNDGPKPTGLRYCMNSAALRFVPVSRLDLEGYGEFKSLFGG